MLGLSAATVLSLLGGIVCLRGEPAYGAVQRCDAWGGEGGLDSVVVAELVRSSTPGTQLCFEVREGVQVLQQLSVPAGVSLEVRGRGGRHAPVVSAAGLREGRVITVARGARLVLHGLVVADAPHGAVWSSGGDVRVISCSFVHNVAAAAEVMQDQPAVQWSAVYAGSALGLTVATRITSGSGRSSLGAQAAAGAAGMLLLPSSVTAPESSCCAGSGDCSGCDLRGLEKSGSPSSPSTCDRFGGALCLEDGNLGVEDSSFVGNSAHKGGAIYWSNRNDVGKSFDVLDSDFLENRAREDDSPNLSGYAGSGGAIFVEGSPTADADPVFLRDVNFTRNVATSQNQRAAREELVYGGALSVVNTNIVAQRCDFIHNGVAESSDADQHAYGGAIAIRATVRDLKVTLESCSFERNDAKEGHAIYSREGGTEEQHNNADANFGGVTLAVVRCSFARNGQLRYGYAGVLTGSGFDAYEGQLYTIVSDSPVQYVESTGLGIEDINIPGQTGPKTVACTEAPSSQAAPLVCPVLYFGPSMWQDGYEPPVENIFDLGNVYTTPGGTTPFTSDQDAVQCADCSTDRPSDCNGFELGVRCTTRKVSGGEEVAVCAPNGYGTGCKFCGFSEQQQHTCGITSAGAAAGNCTAAGPGFKCECNPGWLYNETSQQCDIDIDECWSGPCQNGGTCVDSSEDVRVAPASYRCDCIAGWGGVAEPAFSGDNCQNDVDECASTPCLHASFCIESDLLATGAGTGSQMSSGGRADPPVDLFFAQPACAVEENWQPASWPKTDPTEPNYTIRTTEQLDASAHQMYENCRDDIETLVRKDWGQFGPDDTHVIQLPNGTDLDLQNFDVDGDIKEPLIQAFKDPVNTLRRYSNNAPFNIIAIWCMIKGDDMGGDMTLWPWWCEETRTSMGACAGVNMTYIEYGEGDRRRYASPSIIANRSTFAPFLIEQLGQQAYNLGNPAGSDVQPTPKLTQVLTRLECRALGGCCPAFNGDKTENSTSFPYSPYPGEFDWGPTDSRRTTDCQKQYHDQCRAGNGEAPDLLPGTSLYVDCPESSCKSVASGACVYSNSSNSSRPDKWYVSADDYFEMVQAEPTWAQGQLFINCNSGFDFATHSLPGRQYYREDIAICRSCTSMVPVGAFGCWCEPGWGWDNAPTLPRDVYVTSTGKQVIPAPPIDTRVGVDNCDFQQDNCYDWELQTQPCLNGGKCVNQVNDYKCECTGAWLLGPGWEGKQCQQCEGMLNIFCEDRWITLVVCVGVFVFCAFVARKR